MNNWLSFRSRIASSLAYSADLNGYWSWFRVYFVHPSVPVLVPHSLFAFVHRSVNFTVPFNNPTATRIMSRIDLLDNHIFLWGVRNWVLKEPGHSRYTDGVSTAVSQLLLLRFDITHVYSNYSTPVKFGTEVPNIVLTFESGTKISSSDNVDLRGLTVMCTRSDGVQFQTIPFSISVEFKEAITTLSTHVFSITATTLSATGIYAVYTQSFTDTFMVSISVGPGEYINRHV